MRYITILFVIHFWFTIVLAQTSENDTAKTYTFREIVVTATRSRISLKDSPTQMDVIGFEHIQNANGVTVADLLTNVSSIFVKDQGTNASLKTLSLRGGASEHVLVLVNGNRMNNMQNGLVDFSLMLLNNVERIEIVRGGSSALYGADALGGVVNIITRQATPDFHARTEVQRGSFGYERYVLETQGSFGMFGLLIGYASDRGKDDFSFRTQTPSLPLHDTLMNHRNADFTRRQAYVHGNLTLNGYSSANFSVQNVFEDRGTPGPLGSSYPSPARQNDNEINLMANYVNVGLHDVQLDLNTQYRYALEHYADPSFSYMTFYKNTFFSINPHAQIQVRDWYRIILGAELSQGILESPDFDSKIIRAQKAFYVSNEEYVDVDRPVFNRISLYQTLRYDYISDVDYAVTPKLGMNIRLLDDGDVRLRSSVGKSFRSPSFSDLYFRGFSNPHLRAEHSTSFDVGVLTTLFQGRDFHQPLGNQNLEVTYFYLSTEDRILFDPTQFIPINVGKVISQGIEIKYEGRFLNNHLDYGVNYSITDARKRNRDYSTDSTYGKQIVNIPQHILGFTASLNVEPLTFNFHYNFVGSRYMTADNSTSLSQYWVTNVNIIFRERINSWNIISKIEINNVTGFDYQIFKGYPMPGRSYRMMLGVEY